MDTATSKALGMDTLMDKSPCVDTATARRGYSDASFLLLPILHQKVRNVENLCGKIGAFVLVYGCLLSSYKEYSVHVVLCLIYVSGQ